MPGKIELRSIVHVCKTRDAPAPKPSQGVPEIAVRVQVLGTPGRASIGLSRGVGIYAHQVQTDSAGNALITGVTPGKYSVFVRREGSSAQSAPFTVELRGSDAVIVVGELVGRQ